MDVQAGVAGAEPRELRVELTRAEKSPAAARALIAELLRNDPRAALHVPMLTLLLSEVVTNAVIHPGESAGSRLELSIICDDRLTRVVVSDHGRGFAPEVKPLELSEIGGGQSDDGQSGGGQSGGYGLMLLDKAASRWGTAKDDSRFSVWFEIDHASAPPRAHTA